MCIRDRYKPWDKRRDELVGGTRDPDEEELGALEEYKIPTAEKRSVNLDMDELKNTKGLPGFWLKAMKNNIEIASHIKQHDEPILKFLTNIRVEKEVGDKRKVTFMFDPNEWFTNTELSKEITLDEDDASMCKENVGTEINWNEGKNVTVKTVKKKQKNKKTKATREKIKVTEVESFFNFFKTRNVSENYDDDDKQNEVLAIENDIDMMDEIVESLMPKVLYYYMGLVEEEIEEIGDEDDDANSSDSDSKPKRRKKSKKNSEDAGEAKTETKKECKQQ
eukprot:TRINITY_DN2465_c0_g1_i16.p1 TRINITY_DN2465_c0_g1~~TRINITY_DN2465_c0_g1_i16.p1  ORF type:complete len:278 (-),score=99.62 TRINITY_DN2465_c0_g1_i16:58-891(-)